MRRQTLHAELLRLETELSTLDRKGVLVDAPYPVYERLESDASHPPGLRVRGFAAMNNGIVILYTRDLDLEERKKGHSLVIGEARSYSAVNQGVGTIIRVDSGHASHNQTPHSHTAWTDLVGVEPPSMPPRTRIELGDFISRVEEWRMDNLSILPIFPASLANARLP